MAILVPARSVVAAVACSAPLRIVASTRRVACAQPVATRSPTGPAGPAGAPLASSRTVRPSPSVNVTCQGLALTRARSVPASITNDGAATASLAHSRAKAQASGAILVIA